MQLSLKVIASSLSATHELPGYIVYSTNYMRTTLKKCAMLAGLLFGAAGLATAGNIITFQVDMSAQISAGTFDPTTNNVYVSGSMNGFSSTANITNGFHLTNNPAGDNPALYVGTTNDATDANGAQMTWKFVTDSPSFSGNGGYETTLSGGNRFWVLGTNTTFTLPYTYFNDAGIPILWQAEFRVDMAAFVFSGALDTNAGMTVEVRGDFENWTTGYTLTNDPTIRTTNGTFITSNVYTGVFPLYGSPGQLNHFKYVIYNPNTLAANYEQPNAINGDPAGNNYNRFVLIDTNQSPQILPLVDFGDIVPSQIVTNTVVFQVDMSVMTWLGICNATNSSVVSVQGAFNGWNSTGYSMTNDPNAANTNIYSIVVPNQVAGVGTVVSQFKFLCSPSGNSSYEPGSAFLTYTNGGATVAAGGGNRTWVMPHINNSTIVLPVVYYGDVQPGNNFPTPTLVTFNVNMTNAVTGTNAANPNPYSFNPGSDRVYINGVNYPVPTTANTVTQGASAVAYGDDTTNTAILPFLMTNNPPGSRKYSLQVMVPAGYPVRTGSYRYSINGTNNEGVNNGITNGLPTTGTTIHRRYIRGLGTVQMPLDTFGNVVSEPTTIGNITNGPFSGGVTPLSWPGRHGTILQVTTNLQGARTVWTSLYNTDGIGSTNYPVSGPQLFFELVQPFYWPPSFNY